MTQETTAAQEIATIGQKIENSKTLTITREFYEFTVDELKELAELFKLEDWTDEEIDVDDSDDIQIAIFEKMFFAVWFTAFPGDSGWGFNTITTREYNLVDLANEAISEALPVDRAWNKNTPLQDICDTDINDVQEILIAFESAFETSYSCDTEGNIGV